MEDIEKRLRETSEECLKGYTAWKGDQKNSTARETLHDAIHELRKVASRLEIELAISERDQQALRPMAIPPHRDSQGRTHDGDHDMPDFDGNDMDSGNSGNSNRAQTRMQPRRPQGGGGGGPRRHQGQMQGGGNRRPGREEG